jgi:hypothetical protein
VIKLAIIVFNDTQLLKGTKDRVFWDQTLKPRKQKGLIWYWASNSREKKIKLP